MAAMLALTPSAAFADTLIGANVCDVNVNVIAEQQDDAAQDQCHNS